MGDRVDFNSLARVHVKIFEARNTLAMDITGTSDPYCKVAIDGNCVAKTKTINSTLNPVWNSEYVFSILTIPNSDVPTVFQSVLQVEVWDKDMGSADDFMGYVAIPLGGMEFGKDAWYPLENRPGKEHKKKKQRGDIHIFTKVVRHNTLSQFITANQYVFSIVLSRLVPKDSLAEALSEVLYEMGGTALIDVLRMVISDEVQRTTTSEQLFRTDSIATKMLKVSGRLIGSYWLPATIGGLIKSALTNPANVEVDPARLQPTDNAAQNMQALRTECTKFFNAIMGSFKSAPTLMRQAVSALSESVSWKFPDQRLQSIGGFLFLRYFCPSMSTPEAYGLCDPAHPPTATARRHLLLTAKVLQTLANGVRFVPQKEPYLMPLNDFIDQNTQVYNQTLTDFSTGAIAGQPLASAPLKPDTVMDALETIAEIIISVSPQLQQMFDAATMGHVIPLAESFTTIAKARQGSAANNYMKEK